MPRSFADSLEMRGVYASIAADWILAALIVWYVLRITTTKRVSGQSPGPELLA
jgi:Na+-driven multidrug efflux pump